MCHEQARNKHHWKSNVTDDWWVKGTEVHRERSDAFLDAESSLAVPKSRQLSGPPRSITKQSDDDGCIRNVVSQVNQKLFLGALVFAKITTQLWPAGWVCDSCFA
jgi:hypothetical protein